jgi:hypothetical protein
MKKNIGFPSKNYFENSGSEIIPDTYKNFLSRGENPKQVFMSFCKAQCVDMLERFNKCELENRSQKRKEYTFEHRHSKCIYQYSKWISCIEECVIKNLLPYNFA